MQLESNPSKNQAELDAKRQQLAELEIKSKELINSLPIDTQITILEKEIKELNNKSNKTQTEQALLDSKKQELDRLLVEKNKSNTTKPSDKTILYWGVGIVGTLILLLITIILARNHQKKRKLKK